MKRKGFILKGTKGLTLTEMLIAIMILMIGVVGILALFPVGIHSSRESVDERMASWVADSVAGALKIALRSATPEDAAAGKPAEVTFVHDGLPKGQTFFKFTLPLPTDPPRLRYFCYTPDGPRSGKELTPEQEKDFKPNKVFVLSTDPYLDSAYKNVLTEDPTDPYSQWGFIITASREDDTRPPANRAANLDRGNSMILRLPYTEFR